MQKLLLLLASCALLEPNQAVHHNTCTMRLLFSHVGWDMPIEKLTMWVKDSFNYTITGNALHTFIRRLNCVSDANLLEMELSN